MGPCCIVKGQGRLCLARLLNPVRACQSTAIPRFISSPWCSSLGRFDVQHFTGANEVLTPRRGQTSTRLDWKSCKMSGLHRHLPQAHTMGENGAAVRRRAAPEKESFYHTRQEFSGYMGCPFLQPNAFPNSSKFCTEPFTRQRPGECGSVSASCRETASVWFWHHTWAKPMK